jgi:hypothetical protein
MVPAACTGPSDAPAIQDCRPKFRTCLQRSAILQFKGHLLLPDEPGPGLRVNLDVAEHHLAVESDGGGLGAWPLEVVNVERLRGDTFALSVAGEPLQFVADDSISFAYSGIPAIERISTRRKNRSALRSMFDRIWTGSEQGSTVDADQGAIVEADSAPPMVAEVGGPVEEIVFSADVEAALAESAAEHPEVTIEPWVDADTRYSDEPETAALRPESRTCPTILGDGRRCESTILTASGYCYAHDPRRAFEDKYQAAQEARAQLRRDATDRLNRIYRRLDKAMRQVERGELDPETATAMAQLARTMCAILDLDDPPQDDHR